MTINDIETLQPVLLKKLESLDDPARILKDDAFKSVFMSIKDQPSADRKAFGAKANELKQALLMAINKKNAQKSHTSKPPIDVTAPFDVNSSLPDVLPAVNGTIHPLMQEMKRLTDIFARMGFMVEQSREIDDQYHMFETLNFPKGHPARDDYDTFMTVETDAHGDPFIAPAHTSTMQNRVLSAHKLSLEAGEPIAVIVPDRVFRNEDLDARHEHTFYQLEGVYVDRGVHAGMLVATLKKFLESYYEQELNVRVNPYYFPFTEPSFEFALSCPFCGGKGCSVCSHEGWIELLGCGMIHPNVLKAAGIDPDEYTGFAWGCGIDRLVMMKYGIEDVRHFESAKLDFLRQF